VVDTHRVEVGTVGPLEPSIIDTPAVGRDIDRVSWSSEPSTEVAASASDLSRVARRAAANSRQGVRVA
jgi:hypothetical protein